MALRPPDDFCPPVESSSAPSERELRELWERYESRRRVRDRRVEWRRVVEEVRRSSDGGLKPSEPAAPLPAYLQERSSFGPHARGALRAEARTGRVAAAGVDTWSPCWYAEPGSPLGRAIRALATQRTKFACLLPEMVEGYRIGWFPEARLVFAEGRPRGDGLVAAVDLPGAMRRLRRSLSDLGLPLGGVVSGGIRRLDVAVDLWTDSGPEGLALLECIGNAALGSGKLAVYRSGRCIESVSLKTRSGKTQGRLYDKGIQRGRAPRGRWLRFEAQWRFGRGARPMLEQLDGSALRNCFWRRFEPLWSAAGGMRFGGPGAVAERLEAAVHSGQLLPSRARSIAGYLLLSVSGIPQGARRTTYELERECRELGLSVSLLEGVDRRIDAAAVLEECGRAEKWS
jgi:hypothetical protein